MFKIKYQYKDEETGVRLTPFYGSLPRMAKVMGSKTYIHKGRELIFRVSSAVPTSVFVTITDGWRVLGRARTETPKGCENPVDTLTRAVFNQIDLIL